MSFFELHAAVHHFKRRKARALSLCEHTSKVFPFAIDVLLYQPLPMAYTLRRTAIEKKLLNNMHVSNYSHVHTIPFVRILTGNLSLGEH